MSWSPVGRDVVDALGSLPSSLPSAMCASPDFVPSCLVLVLSPPCGGATDASGGWHHTTTALSPVAVGEAEAAILPVRRE
jgi:hypothetical protein